MSTQHTPGPWQFDLQIQDPPIVFDSESQMIAELCTLSEDGREELANARLIAAAPDLLEACKAALVDVSDSAVVLMLQSVIAKAEGVS